MAVKVRLAASTKPAAEEMGRLNAGWMESGLLYCLDELVHKHRLGTRMEALRWLISQKAKKDPELRPFVPEKYLDDDTGF